MAGKPSIDGSNILYHYLQKELYQNDIWFFQMLVAPHANPTDGLLDMMVIGDISKPDLLWSLPRVYRGTHLTHRKVTASKAREVKVQSRYQMPLQADGEPLGETLVAGFYVMPAA